MMNTITALSDELGFVQDQSGKPAVSDNAGILCTEMGIPDESMVPITHIIFVGEDGEETPIAVEPGKYKSALAVAVYAHKVLNYPYGTFAGVVPVDANFKEFFARFLGAEITEDAIDPGTKHTFAHLVFYNATGAQVYFYNHHDGEAA